MFGDHVERLWRCIDRSMPRRRSSRRLSGLGDPVIDAGQEWANAFEGTATGTTVSGTNSADDTTRARHALRPSELTDLAAERDLRSAAGHFRNHASQQTYSIRLLRRREPGDRAG